MVTGIPFSTYLMKNCIGELIVNTTPFTRRSAGIPMLLVSILISSQTDSQRDELTNTALTQLLTVSVEPVYLKSLKGTEPNEWRLPQVHAQNAMKAIFTEGKLAQNSFGFIEAAFVVAIDGFGSDVGPQWHRCRAPALFAGAARRRAARVLPGADVPSAVHHDR